MNVPQDELDALAARLLSLRTLVQQSTRQRGRPQFDALQHADTQFAALLVRLIDAGARDPYQTPSPPSRTDVGTRLVSLALLDTPANRAYHDALHVAYTCALAVDRERYGDAIGTDGPAQALERLLHDVQQERHGPTSPHE